MKATELREKNNDELNQELEELNQEQFKLGMQRATGQLTKPHLVHNVRRNIARVKTIIHEMTSKAGSNHE